MTPHPGAQYLAELEASAKKATQGEWETVERQGFDEAWCDWHQVGPFSLMGPALSDDDRHIANASPARIAAIVEYVAGLAPQRMWCLTCGTLTTDRSCHCTEGDGEGPQNLVSESGELSRRLASEKARADAAEAERDRLYNADDMIGNGVGDLTAAEEVLAFFLVEKIGVPDDVPYSPNAACKIVSERIDDLEATIASLTEQLAEARDDLEALLSWFPDKPAEPEWRLKAGPYGADEAVSAARATLSRLEKQEGEK